MEKKHSFARLWSYLKVYKVSVILAVFLKILSVVMSVLEPFVLGLYYVNYIINLSDSFVNGIDLFSRDILKELDFSNSSLFNTSYFDLTGLS